MIPELRTRFNQEFSPDRYAKLLALLQERCRVPVEFRVAETPVFVKKAMMDEMAGAGCQLAKSLLGNSSYLEAARQAIPVQYRVSGEEGHPHFLTADFALVRDRAGRLTPKLVEIQAFPSVYAYQAILGCAYREAYGLATGLKRYLCGLDDTLYWKMLTKTVLGKLDPENVVLTEIDPAHQKTRVDFEVTARKLGIAVVDIRSLEAVGNRLHYRNGKGKLVPIHRIYNRAIADELMAREIRLPFDLTRRWDVQWAGHPNWYFLISKFSIPWLTREAAPDSVVPPAVFLDEFLEGDGRARLRAAGVDVPDAAGADTVYPMLLLKPLFSFAGKGIRFEPRQAELEAIPRERRHDYLLQERMTFVHNIETPCGLTQAEFRILYLWPEDGNLTPVLPLVRLGRGKMMGVDHNRNQEWVGGSAAFLEE
ncbi:hypothetical protein DYQ86_17145 [Acidobacteria bacterium AB60]|nr:hypothetical protein DYQ86_17145 [Acidobacteria bacterium AB60]